MSGKNQATIGSAPWMSTMPADGLCTTCGKKMRHSHAHAATVPGTVRYGGKGRCASCANKERRRIEDPLHATHQRGIGGGRRRKREEVLEDWVIIRDRLGGLDRMQGYLLIGRAAKDMGMSHTALEKHLERARKAGDRRGNLRCFDRETDRGWAA